VFSLEPELRSLAAGGLLGEEEAARLVALERREVFSLFAEIRTLAWLGVMLIAGGVGIIVSKHLDDIGPITLAAIIGFASAGCYVFAFWHRKRALSIIDDFVLLLGALLLSADVGYIEHQFHLLGSGWPRHLLLLAVLHAAGAYFFDSRALLSLSISSLAAWLGIERRVGDVFDSSLDTALRGFLCAATIVVWRIVDHRLRRSRSFAGIFDHFAANLAFWSALTLTAEDHLRTAACLLALVLAFAAGIYGWKRRAEAFVIYGWGYGTIAVDILFAQFVRDEVLISLFLVASTIASIVGLIAVHARYTRGVR
jgi:hypothetical protein